MVFPLPNSAWFLLSTFTLMDCTLYVQFLPLPCIYSPTTTLRTSAPSLKVQLCIHWIAQGINSSIMLCWHTVTSHLQKEENRNYVTVGRSHSYAANESIWKKKKKVPFRFSAISYKTHYKSQMGSGQTPVWTITGFSFPTSVQPSKWNTLSFTVLNSHVLIKHLFKSTKRSTRLQCTLEMVGFCI